MIFHDDTFICYHLSLQWQAIVKFTVDKYLSTLRCVVRARAKKIMKLIVYLWTCLGLHVGWNDKILLRLNSNLSRHAVVPQDRKESHVAWQKEVGSRRVIQYLPGSLHPRGVAFSVPAQICKAQQLLLQSLHDSCVKCRFIYFSSSYWELQLFDVQCAAQVLHYKY